MCSEARPKGQSVMNEPDPSHWSIHCMCRPPGRMPLAALARLATAACSRPAPPPGTPLLFLSSPLLSLFLLTTAWQGWTSAPQSKPAAAAAAAAGGPLGSSAICPRVQQAPALLFPEVKEVVGDTSRPAGHPPAPTAHPLQHRLPRCRAPQAKLPTLPPSLPEPARNQERTPACSRHLTSPLGASRSELPYLLNST